jgi:hypothetical protein
MMNVVMEMVPATYASMYSTAEMQKLQVTHDGVISIGSSHKFNLVSLSKKIKT